MKEVGVISTAKFKVGQVPFPEAALARFSRIRAEIWLERFKATGKLPADAPALPP